MSDILKKIEEMQEQLKELAEQIEESIESEDETINTLDDLFGDDNDGLFGSDTGGFGGTSSFVSDTGFCSNESLGINTSCDVLKSGFKGKSRKKKEKAPEFDYTESRKYNCTSDCANCIYEKGCKYSTKNIKHIRLNNRQYEQLEKFGEAVSNYWKDPFGSKYGKMKIVKEFTEFARIYDKREKIHKRIIIALGAAIGLGAATMIIKGLTSKK